MTRALCSAALALTLAVSAHAAGPAAADRGLALFQKQVRPLLTKRCLQCHGGAKVKGGFDLSTRERFLKGGKSGAVVVPGNAKASKVMLQVQKLEKPKMPPKEWLTVEEITAMQGWIDAGAPYDAPLK